MRVVITEKYRQGEVVASALPGSAEEQEMRDEPLWRVDDVVVVPLQGQIWELDPVEGRSGYPDFPEVEWSVSPDQKSKRRVLSDLLDAESLEEVVIATDLDREGELIGTLAVLLPRWDEADYQQIHDWEIPVTRMEYSSMVESEIEEAWEERGDPNEDLFEVGWARAEIDLRVGINISRALSQCFVRGKGSWRSLSAGRVQTPTLNIVWDRQREHESHDPDPYWIPRISL